VGAGIGGSYSWETAVPYLSATGEFETADYVDWQNFNGPGSLMQGSIDAFFIGYSIGWINFTMLTTDPEYISIRGLQSFGVELAVAAVVGKFEVLD
jgi:hypothetical protein